MSETYEAADGITGIDTGMAGLQRVTSAYLVKAEEPSLVETGPGSTAAVVRASLAQLGIGPNDLAHIVVTHIHLDHAGGAGDLSEAFPKATIWVHGRGAAHLADPERLVASTIRTYGEDRARALFGDTRPVPADRIRSAEHETDIPLGKTRALRVLHTPGHASHHLALQDSQTGALFTGDAVGVHLPALTALRAAAPPPEFDMELALGSIATISERARDTLLFSHFGPAADAESVCALAAQRIRESADLVRLVLQRTQDIDEIAAELRSLAGRDERDLSPEDAAALDISGDLRLNALGLVRYWTKRDERNQADSSAANRSAASNAPES